MVFGQSTRIGRRARVWVVVMGMSCAVVDSRGYWVGGGVPIVVVLVLG